MKGLVKVFILLVFTLCLFRLFFWSGDYLTNLFHQAESSSTNNQLTFVGPKALDQYTIENLSRRPYLGSEFRIEKEISRQEKFSSHPFSFKTRGRKVTGLVNLPVSNGGPFPVVLLVRGYVDREVYRTGVGTSRVGEAFAAAGYVTLAPDFLGYGGSDPPSSEPLEERFQTYTTLLDLYGLVSASSSGQCQTSNIKCQMIYLWAHSNGGQIALTFLEITGQVLPTVLWAPVSKPFPYSILYYTDEAEDKGKWLRSVVSKFEQRYDVNRYSVTEYFGKIQSPILLQQGTKDEAVPQAWSDELSQNLRRLEKDITYEIYVGADHNLAGSWNEAVNKALGFFSSQSH